MLPSYFSEDKEILTDPEDFLPSEIYPEEGGDTEDLAWEDDLCIEEIDLLLLGLLQR